MSNQTRKQTPETPRSLRPMSAALGFLICLMAEIFYLGSNFLLRCMTDYPEVSSDWTLLMKESVTVFSSLIIISWLVFQKKYRWPDGKSILIIILAGIFCQLVGARFHLWAYAIIGIVLTMPLIQTLELLGISILGSTFLNEKMTRLKTMTMLVLIVAILAIAMSQLTLDKADQTALAGAAGMKHHILVGFFAAFMAAVGYGCFILLVRYVMRSNSSEKKTEIATDNDSPTESLPVSSESEQNDERVPMPISLSMLLICGVGMIVGASFLWAEKGLSAFWTVPNECWFIAIGCGILNCIGFYFRNLGFRSVTASKIAFISAFQILVLSLLGITFFHEPANALLGIGLVLTTAGIIMAGFSR